MVTLSILLKLWCAVIRPTTMHCPGNWWLNGVRSDGTYECRAQRDDVDLAIQGRIYCNDGLLPVAINHFTAACKRARYQH